jgi:hypothetical protein
MKITTSTQFTICTVVLLIAVVNGGCKTATIDKTTTAASAAVSGEQPVIPAKDDLICYFACDEAVNGNAVDAAESGVKAIYSGDIPSLVDGSVGKVLGCFGQGSQDLFRHGLNLGKSDYTIAFWVNVSGYIMHGSEDRIEERGLVVYGYRPELSVFLNDSGKVTLEMPDAGNASMSASGVPPKQKWTHLAFVVDRDSNAGCSIYMNGQKLHMTSVSMAASADHDYNMNTGFMFGRTLVGHLDDLAVYRKALTSVEVNALSGIIPEGTPMIASPVSEVDTLPPERKPYRLKAARKAAAQKKRRIVYNDDGVYVHPFDTPDKFIGVRLKQTFDSQVDTVFFNVGATTMFTFDNEVGETYGEFINEKSPAWARNVKKSIAGLRETGDGTGGLALEHCHKHGIEFFFSLRMNDIHDSFIPFMRSRWKRNHPQLLFGPKSLNYEHPEVRDYIYRIIESFCTNFDVDGIELDWWRGPRAFPPSWEGKPLEPLHLELMNNLMRRIRYMTERVGEERGRPILLAARTPTSVERSLFLGFDLKTWFEEDLLDILAVGGGYAPMAIVSSVREMVDFAQPYGVPVHSAISGSSMGANREYGTGHDYYTVEAWRGAAMNIWHAGAGGVYTFNFFPRQEEKDKHLYQLFDQMGSPETLKGLDKIYSIDRMIIEDFPPKGRWALVAPDRLPIRLKKDGWAQAKLPVGEDIAANTPAGKACTSRLRLKLTSLAEGDKVLMRLNGNELGEAAPTEALSSEPGAAWVALELDPKLVKEGYNIFDVKLSSQRDLAEMSNIDRLDLTVRYQ